MGRHSPGGLVLIGSKPLDIHGKIKKSLKKWVALKEVKGEGSKLEIRPIEDSSTKEDL